MRGEAHTLICTVGTSLPGNLNRLQEGETDRVRTAMREAYRQGNWLKLAKELGKVDPGDRMCGAEINSVTDLLSHGHVAKGQLHLLVSDTRDGEAMGATLKHYFRQAGWRADCRRIEGLKDDDPRSFRTRGLRNLVKIIGAKVQEAGAQFCAIDATGGYKAQIAIAVLMGQALGIPVYYKHERFSEIIPFPPMPVALDSLLWVRANRMFFALSRPDACEPASRFEKEWDDRLETLINRVPIDGEEYLALSAIGQIFHEAFRMRFRRSKASRLPRAANPSEKKDPELHHHSYKRAEEPIRRHLTRVTQGRPYVRYCDTTYWSPDLPNTCGFRLSGHGVEGIYSNGTWCVKFRVVTTADEQADLGVVAADLNQWLEERG